MKRIAIEVDDIFKKEVQSHIVKYDYESIRKFVIKAIRKQIKNDREEN